MSKPLDNMGKKHSICPTRAQFESDLTFFARVINIDHHLDHGQQGLSAKMMEFALSEIQELGLRKVEPIDLVAFLILGKYLFGPAKPPGLGSKSHNDQGTLGSGYTNTVLNSLIRAGDLVDDAVRFIELTGEDKWCQMVAPTLNMTQNLIASVLPVLELRQEAIRISRWRPCATNHLHKLYLANGANLRSALKKVSSMKSSDAIRHAIDRAITEELDMTDFAKFVQRMNQRRIFQDMNGAVLKTQVKLQSQCTRKSDPIPRSRPASSRARQ